MVNASKGQSLQLSLSYYSVGLLIGISLSLISSRSLGVGFNPSKLYTDNEVSLVTNGFQNLNVPTNKV
jgi:hypothetical protein